MTGLDGEVVQSPGSKGKELMMEGVVQINCAQQPPDPPPTAPSNGGVTTTNEAGDGTKTALSASLNAAFLARVILTSNPVRAVVLAQELTRERQETAQRESPRRVSGTLRALPFEAVSTSSSPPRLLSIFFPPVASLPPRPPAVALQRNPTKGQLTSLDLDQVVLVEGVTSDGILSLVVSKVLEYEFLLVDVTRLCG